MGYKSDARLVTTKEGYEIMKSYIETGMKHDLEMINILDYLEIDDKIGDLVYLGWDFVNSRVIDEVENVTSELSDKDISYRLSIIGESLDDITEDSHTSEKDDCLPFPSISREFDEQAMEQEFQCYLKEYNKKNNVEMEMVNSE